MKKTLKYLLVLLALLVLQGCEPPGPRGVAGERCLPGYVCNPGLQCQVTPQFSVCVPIGVRQ